MILRSLVSMPPNPLAGPFKIGDATDYVEFDPANGQHTLAGSARPTDRVFMYGPRSSIYNVGTVTGTQLSVSAGTESAIEAVQVGAVNDGGWRTFVTIIPRWADISEDANVLAVVQAVAAASGNMALQVNWDRARNGTTGVSEGSVSNTPAGPGAQDEILYAIAGTIPGGTFQTGDLVSFAIQRMASTEPGDTYTQALRIARFGWIEFKRKAW